MCQKYIIRHLLYVVVLISLLSVYILNWGELSLSRACSTTMPLPRPETRLQPGGRLRHTDMTRRYPLFKWPTT